MQSDVQLASMAGNVAARGYMYAATRKTRLGSMPLLHYNKAVLPSVVHVGASDCSLPPSFADCLVEAYSNAMEGYYLSREEEGQ